MSRPRLRVLPPLEPPGPPRRPDGGPAALASFLARAPEPGADPAAWSAALVAAFRRDRPAETPKGTARAVAMFGVLACFATLLHWGADAPVPPPQLAALLDVKGFLESPRGKARRRRVEAVAAAPPGPGLVPALARLLSRAATTRSGDEAAALVTEALERLARARGARAVRAALARTGP